MAKQQEETPLWQTVAPVEFSPITDQKPDAQAILINARQGAGFEVAAGQISHAVQSRATHLLLDYSQSACAIRYQIDGAWEAIDSIDRESGDAMLYALKQLCQLNPADRRSAQSGECDMKLGKEKFRLTLQSKGIPTGERVLARITAEKVPFERLADLGMRDKMVENFKSQLNAEGNLVVISAPKTEGLTTTWNVSLNAADRLVRDFQSFEPQSSPEPDVINVSPNFYDGDTGLTLIQLLDKMIRKEPDVLVFPKLPDGDAMQIAMGQVSKADKQVITRLVAGSAVEALVKLIAQYKESAKLIAERTGAVSNQRLIRRLCENCKVGFEPPPKLLQQLGIPAGRVAMLYKPFIPPPIEQQVDENGKPAPITPCHVCDGRGYYGRIAVFELLTPGPKLRQALLKTQDVGQLASIAKSEGHRGIQAEAVLTVARGLTSLDELKRAFAKK